MSTTKSAQLRILGILAVLLPIIFLMQGCSTTDSGPQDEKPAKAQLRKESASSQTASELRNGPKEEPSNVVDLPEGFAKYQNVAISFYHPLGWTVVEQTSSSLVVSSDEAALYIAWQRQPQDAGYAFDQALKSTESRSNAIDFMKANLQETLTDRGLADLNIGAFDMERIGSMRVFAETAFTGWARIPALDNQVVEVIAIPSVECGPVLTCGFTYMNRYPPEITEDEFTLLFDILKSVKTVATDAQ